MLIILTMIEDLAKFMFGSDRIKIDMDSLVSFLVGEDPAILIEDWDEAGIVRQDGKIIIYLPLQVEVIEEHEDYSWIEEWNEFRGEFYDNTCRFGKSKPFKRYAGKVVI